MALALRERNGKQGLEPLTRNLTSTFCKFRQNRRGSRLGFGHVASDGQHLLGHTDSSPTGHVSIEMHPMDASSLPPSWMDPVEEAREDLKSIQNKIVQLTKAQNKRLLKVFDESGAPDKEVEAISSSIGTLVRRCENSIHQVKSRGSCLNATDRELRDNVQRNLATSLQDLSQEFRQAQKQYLSKVQERQRGSTLFDLDAGASGSSSRGGGQGGDIGFNEDQLLGLETMETNAQTRSEEICQIASSINDLHTIFKELAVLVIDQGSILDRIDYNIEQVVDQSKEANVQLKKAEKAQKSNRAMKCLLILCVMNLIMIFILFMKSRS